MIYPEHILPKSELDNLIQSGSLTKEKICKICQQLKVPLGIGLSSKNDGDLSKRQEFYGVNIPLVAPPSANFCQTIAKCFKELQPKFIRNILIVAFIVYVGICLIASRQVNDQGTFYDWSIIATVVIFLFLTFPVFLDAIFRYKRQSNLQRVLNRLGKLETVRVLRDGVIVSLKPKEIVVGDICQLNAGDVIPVDGLQIQETNEVTKCKVPSELLMYNAVQEGHFMAGSVVSEGNFQLLATSVGLNTKLAFRCAQGMVPPNLVLNVGAILYIAIVAGLTPIFLFTIRFSFVTFIVEQRSWDNNYISRYLSPLLTGLITFLQNLPFSLPIVILWTRYHATKQGQTGNALRMDTITAENTSKFVQFILPANLIEFFTWTIYDCFSSPHIPTAYSRGFGWVQEIATAGLGLMLFPSEKMPVDPEFTGEKVFSPTVIKNILGQLFYQGTIIFTYIYLSVFHGSAFHIQQTLIRNTCVLMTLCNIFCARISASNSRQRNVFAGICQHRIFCVSWVILFVLQIAISHYNADAEFPDASPLDLVLDVLCCLLPAGGVFIWAQLLISINVEKGLRSSKRHEVYKAADDGTSVGMMTQDDPAV